MQSLMTDSKFVHVASPGNSRRAVSALSRIFFSLHSSPALEEQPLTDGDAGE